MRRLIALLSVSWILSIASHLSVSHALELADDSEKPLSGDLVVWKTSDQTARLAQGETLGFWIRVPSTQCGAFKLEGSSRIKRELYAAPPFKTEKPSYRGARVGQWLDPLVRQPLESEICGLPSIEGHRYFFLDVAIDGAEPESLKVVFAKKDITLKLKPWRWKIPELASFPIYAELSTWLSLVGHHGKWEEGEGALASQYLELMFAHRVYPLKTWITRPGIESKDAAPAVLKLASDPSPGDSIQTLVGSRMPEAGLVNVPMVELGWSDAEKDRYWRALTQAWRSWPRSQKPLVWLFDEPEDKDVPMLVKEAERIRKWAPDARVLLTEPWSKKMDRLVDIWVPNLAQFGQDKTPGPEVYLKHRRKNSELWWYSSCMSHGCTNDTDADLPDLVIDRGAAFVRSIPWLAYRNGVSGFLYYSLNDGYRRMPGQDPWNTLFDWTGNGDGTLLYPQRVGMFGATHHAPAASVRLKLLRRIAFDGEYLELAKKHRKKLPGPIQNRWQKAADSLQKWSKRGSDYEALRKEIGEWIEADRLQ